MTLHKISRLAILLVAAVVATATVTVAVESSRAVLTANAAVFPYFLSPGANSAPIVPVASQPVLVMGVQNAVGVRGVGQVTLLRVPGSFLEWVGLNSTAGAGITQGFSGTLGTNIVFLDFAHQVAIQVNSPDSFRIHNGSTGVRFGNVTLIW
jgi:hypothetical protein